MKYDPKEVFLRELTEMYYSNDYDANEAINYFNTQNSVERKEIVHTFFSIYDLNLRGMRTQSCYEFYDKICPAALKNIFISDYLYPNYISEYINNPHFIQFNNLSDNFFSNVIMNNKIDFLKLFSISPSKKLLLNNLNFEFNEEEINEIKKVIDSKLEIKELEYKKTIMNKIGIYNTYLLFEFNESTKEEEFEFFFENINKFNDEQLLKIVFHNFFYNNSMIISLKTTNGESFRLKEYLHLYNVKPEIFAIINNIFKNKKHSDMIYIENFLKNIPGLYDIMDIIYEKINISLMLKNF